MFRVVCATVVAICIAAPAHAAGRLFVVSKAKKALQVFDAETGKMEFEIAGHGEPHEVAVTTDGRFAFIGDAVGYKNTVTVVDVEKRAVSEEINFQPHLRAHGLAVTKDGTKLYATSAPTRAVVELTSSPLKIARTFKFFADTVENIALTPDESLLFASSSFDGNIQVIDLAKGEFERSIISGAGAEGLNVTPDGTELWVSNRVDQTVAVIDLAKRKRVATIPCVGNPMHVYFTADGSEAVVTVAVGDRLAIFNRAKRTETTRFEVGDFPIEMTWGEAGGPAFVACAVGNDIAVVDIAARKVLRRIPCGGDPEGIAYAPK
jgi:YVTN family beta-propeller protein